MVAAFGSIPSCDGLFVTDLSDSNTVGSYFNPQECCHEPVWRTLIFLENRNKIGQRNLSACVRQMG